MTNGYPETTSGLGYRFDHEGCQYGQETRRMAEASKKFTDDGCSYGQANRKEIVDMKESTRWTNRLLITQLLVFVVALGVYVVTR